MIFDHDMPLPYRSFSLGYILDVPVIGSGWPRDIGPFTFARSLCGPVSVRADCCTPSHHDSIVIVSVL